MGRTTSCIAVLTVLLFSAECFGQGYICAVGGGGEDYNSWSDAPYGWIVQKADSGSIIVLASSTQTEWIPTYFMSLGASSSFNYTISSRAIANDSATYNAIRQSQGVFIKGGDQWQYVSLWRGTLTEQAIREVFFGGGVVAGTSAGAMVLSAVVSDAHYGTAVSRGALRNPRSQNLSTTTDFLQLVPGSLIDSHFHERGRFGRLLALVGTHYLDTGQPIVGVGIEDLQRSVLHRMVSVKLWVLDRSRSSIRPLKPQSCPKRANRSFLQMFSSMHWLGYRYDLNAHQVAYIPSSALVPGPGSSSPVANRISLFGDAFPPPSGVSKFISDAGGIGNSFAVVATIIHVGRSTICRHSNRPGAANATIVLLDSTSANNPVSAQVVADAAGIIFTSNVGEQFPAYVDSMTLVGAALGSRLQSGVAVGYSSQDAKLAGRTVVFRTELEEYASYRGKLALGSGTQALKNLLVMPLIFQSDVYDENRSTGLIWGMAKTDCKTGIYLDEADMYP